MTAARSLEPPLPAPTRLLAGRYEILAPLGRGMFATAFRARDHALARDVCIKRLLTPPMPELPDPARAFHEEARILARVRHGNVVALLDVGEEAPGAPFLVLELVEGLDLRAFLEARRREDAGDAGEAGEDAGYVAPPLAVHIACALLRALAAAADTAPGFVHRDVSPNNVLLARSGEVKLADFGIALTRDRPRWTRPSLVKGKPGYMAPEQIRGEPIDARADLFAVGVILFELLTRRRPSRPRARGEAGAMRELHAIATGHIDSLHEARRDVDPHLARAVDRLLAFEPRHRYRDAADALRSLGPFGAGEVGSLRVASLACDPRM